MATPTSPLTGARGAARFVFLVTVSHLLAYVASSAVVAGVIRAPVRRLGRRAGAVASATRLRSVPPPAL